MRKLIVIVIFLCPLAVLAQIDKIKPRMSVSDIRQLFPKAVPDSGYMTSGIYSTKPLVWIKGGADIEFMRDTVISYDFVSDLIAGPCARYPRADSFPYSVLMNAVRKLYSDYNLRYGKPDVYYVVPEFAPNTNKELASVFHAEWKKSFINILLDVGRYGTKKGFERMSKMPYYEDLPDGCHYTMELKTKGKGDKFPESGCIGMTADEFNKIYPEEAESVNVLARRKDSWRAGDTGVLHQSFWTFTFVKGVLNSYGFQIYFESQNQKKCSNAFSLMRNRALVFLAEAEKAYGKPDTIISSMPDKFRANSVKKFYKREYLNVEWKLKTGNLYIYFSDWSVGKVPFPEFHLGVDYVDETAKK